MAAPSGDKYRDYLSEEEVKKTAWRFGPPNYAVVNKLFEEGRAKEWPVGSLEEKAQRLVLTFEMEIINKVDPDQCKSIDAEKFTCSVNGRKPVTWEEIQQLGGCYNVFMQTNLPEKFRVYDPTKETMETGLKAFMSAFPRGFAMEVLEVYSGPPLLVYKYRHWAYFEGFFKEFPPTGELVEFVGVAVFQLDEHSRIVRMESFWDPGSFYEGLLKGTVSD